MVATAQGRLSNVDKRLGNLYFQRVSRVASGKALLVDTKSIQFTLPLLPGGSICTFEHKWQCVASVARQLVLAFVGSGQQPLSEFDQVAFTN